MYAIENVEKNFSAAQNYVQVIHVYTYFPLGYIYHISYIMYCILCVLCCMHASRSEFSFNSSNLLSGISIFIHRTGVAELTHRAESSAGELKTSVNEMTLVDSGGKVLGVSLWIYMYICIGVYEYI